MEKGEFIKTCLLGTVGIITYPAFAGNKKIKLKENFEITPTFTETSLKSRFFEKDELKGHYEYHFVSPAKFLNSLGLNSKSRKIFRNAGKFNNEILQNAGSFYNHRMFFKTITSIGEANPPSKKLNYLLTTHFGSVDGFKHEFNSVAKKQQVDGWAWLVIKNGKLKVISTNNNDNPLMVTLPTYQQGFPLIGIDLWKHAYEGTYAANKESYLNNFHASINWSYIATRLERARKGGYTV